MNPRRLAQVPEPLPGGLVVVGMSDERTNPGPTNPGDEAAPGTPGTGENICPHCNGRGRHDDGSECPVCGGTGKVVEGLAGG